MRYLTFAAVGIGIMAVAFFAGRTLWPQKELALVNNFAPQTNGEGAVSITVAPQNLQKSGLWEFAVALNTHSVELNEDLAEASFLIDGAGKEYPPTAWEGAPPGGHHREGILKFNPLVPAPDLIKLKILDIGDVPERIFVWKIGG